jgi:hypothetical protein
MFSNLPNYIMKLDLEIGGATSLYDRITEIALVQLKCGVETGRPFITRLSGITTQLVLGTRPTSFSKSYFAVSSCKAYRFKNNHYGIWTS